MNDIQARHRKEQKDLQSRITQKKHNATKKTRKGVNDECERLERDLRERQQAELHGNVDVDAEVTQPLRELEVEDSKEHVLADSDGNAPVSKRESAIISAVTTHEQQPRAKKPSRQKARLARRAADQEAQIAQAEQEAANLPDLRRQEMTSMKQHMDNMHLTETLIRPDGHCLFSACAMNIPNSQVKQSGPFTEDYRNVRFAAADFISKHPDDFAAFLEEPLDTYVTKIKETAEWGGQLELQAIARHYQVLINVLQADGRVEKIVPDEADADKPHIWLAYYRHSFGLGEHYNALKQTNI